jgi:hypothetical protein
MLVVEMNAGHIVEDVRLDAEGRCPVEFCGRTGGVIPLPEESRSAPPYWERHFPEGCSWTHPAGGLFLWARVPEWIDTAELLKEVVAHKVA